MKLIFENVGEDIAFALAEGAKELGIETDTPKQIEVMKRKWAEYEAAHGGPKNGGLNSAD